MTRSIHRLWVLTLALPLLLAACGQSPSGNQGAAPTAASAPAPTADTAAAPITAPASSEPVTVRLAHFPNLTHAVGVIGVARGTFKGALGSNVTLDVKTFNAGPAMIEALFAGEIDLGYIGPNPAINGYVRSRGEALRIIAGASSGGALFIVRPEANIKAAKDLENKKVATPQKGGTQDIALRHYIKENGLKTTEEGGTVQVLPTENPTILTLFQQGQLDGAWVPEPWASRLILEGKGEVFIDERTVWPEGKFVSTNVIVNKKFLDAHPDLVAKFLQAHVDTVEWVNSNKTEAKSIINQEIERITSKGLPAEVLDKAFETTDITYDPLPETLFKSADDAFNLGFLGDTKPDLAGIYDLKPLNDVLAAKKLPLVQTP
ncbi:MAG: aliphatic sulfonate ABC transporter substrate-binding protein [Roseiflexaceae bacterium]